MADRDLAATGLHTEPDLQRAARLLWERVPEPYRPPPTPQQSWRTLRAGALLELREPWFDGRQRWPAGTRFVVEDPTSEGVKLRAQLTGPTEAATFSTSWTHPDWQSTFARVRQSRAPKKTKHEPTT